jgi:hypothetical protein
VREKKRAARVARREARAAVAEAAKRRAEEAAAAAAAAGASAEAAAASDGTALYSQELVDTYVHLMYGLSKDWCASGLRLGVLYTRNRRLHQVTSRPVAGCHLHRRSLPASPIPLLPGLPSGCGPFCLADDKHTPILTRRLSLILHANSCPPPPPPLFPPVPLPPSPWTPSPCSRGCPTLRSGRWRRRWTTPTGPPPSCGTTLACWRPPTTCWRVCVCVKGGGGARAAGLDAIFAAMLGDCAWVGRARDRAQGGVALEEGMGCMVVGRSGLQAV